MTPDGKEDRNTVALIGYARVSTADPSLALHRDALATVGGDPVFEDQASGSKATRPGSIQAFAYVRRDGQVLWKLDRLGRPTAHLIETVRAHQAWRGGFLVADGSGGR